MSSYIPKAEKSKRKRIEVVLVSSDREMKKLFDENLWVLDILELQLTDKQVESLEIPTIKEDSELYYFAHDLCDAIKKALKDLPLTGRDFAKMRILRNDGWIPLEKELISHPGLHRDWKVFVCCENISDVNIDVISDFAELLRGYLKSTELREIYRTKITSDSSEKDDIFTIAEKNGRLPKTGKLFDVVKENQENLLYLPESIKQLFLKDEKIRRKIIKLLSKLPFDKLADHLYMFPADIIQEVLEVENELALIFSRSYESRKVSSLKMLRLFLGTASKNKALISKYASAVDWGKVDISDMKIVFFSREGITDETRLIILNEIPSDQVLNVGKQIQDMTTDVFIKPYLAHDVLKLFMKNSNDPAAELATFIKEGRRLILYISKPEEPTERIHFERRYKDQIEECNKKAAIPATDYIYEILNFENLSEKAISIMSEILLEKKGCWLYDMLKDLFYLHYKEIDPGFFTFLFSMNSAEHIIPRWMEADWLINTYNIVYEQEQNKEGIFSKEKLLKILLGRYFVGSDLSEEDKVLISKRISKKGLESTNPFIEEIKQAFKLSKDDNLLSEIEKLQKENPTALNEFDWFMYLPLFVDKKLKFKIDDDPLKVEKTIVARLVDDEKPLQVWKDVFPELIKSHLWKDLIVKIFKNLVPEKELYLSALKILLDEIWEDEYYYSHIWNKIHMLIYVLWEKEGIPNKEEFLTITISELNDRKYRNSLEKDFALADPATHFLDKKTFRSDLGIDEDLINRIGNFLIELRTTARNGESSINEKDEFIIFEIAHILYHYKGPWNALKPLLLLFRAIPKQCVNLEQEVMLQDRSVSWINVPYAITSIISEASKNEEDAKELRLNWFKDMTDKLKPVKEEKADRRNYETVNPEFNKGFAPSLKEPHPLWRVIYCEAAADLKTSPGNKGRYVFDKVKESDPDEEVKAAAERTARRVARIKDQFGEGSHKTALMNAWWWYRIGHIQSTGGKVDMDLAETIKSKEVRRNY